MRKLLCLHWTLEAEVVVVGVGDGEALHVVDGNHGLLQHGNAEGKKMMEGRVHIGQPKNSAVSACAAMRAGSGHQSS